MRRNNRRNDRYDDYDDDYGDEERYRRSRRRGKRRSNGWLDQKARNDPGGLAMGIMIILFICGMLSLLLL